MCGTCSVPGGFIEPSRLCSPPSARPLSASPKSGKTSPSSDPAQETGVPDLGKQEPLGQFGQGFFSCIQLLMPNIAVRCQLLCLRPPRLIQDRVDNPCLAYIKMAAKAQICSPSAFGKTPTPRRTPRRHTAAEKARLSAWPLPVKFPRARPWTPSNAQTRPIVSVQHFTSFLVHLPLLYDSQRLLFIFSVISPILQSLQNS